MRICTKCKLNKEICDFYKGRCECKCCGQEYKLKTALHIKEQKKEYYKLNKEKISKRCAAYQSSNKLKYKEIGKRYRENNKEKINLQIKEWQIKNSARRKAHWAFRQRNDINYRLKKQMRSRIWSALKGRCKSAKTFSLLGCSLGEFKTYLKSKFKVGMTWENYGKWHVDHILPCASFDLSDPEEQNECFNYKNLQPLWASDNIRKSDKII